MGYDSNNDLFALTAFQLKYSHDGASHLQTVYSENNDVTFTGSSDPEEEIRNPFRVPIVARYLRLIPERDLNNLIGLRWEVLGCAHGK